MNTPGQPFSRIQLGRAWMDEVRATAVVSAADDDIEEFLRDLLDRLIDALEQPEFCALPAAEVGSRLAARGFVGERSLGCTMKILGAGLLMLPELGVDDLHDKVILLLAELAAGYTTALRHWLLAQQENVKHALYRVSQTAELERRVSEARFREVFEAAPVGMAISRIGGPITETNGALTEILHYLPAELTGRRIHEFFHPDDSAALSAAYDDLIEGRPARFRHRAKLLDAKGDTTRVSLAVSVLRDAEGNPTHYVTMVEDFTDVHLLEERLRHQTLHDLLTGLPNQEYFWIHLKSVLERAASGATLTLCKIDLDGFEIINDGHGHEVGNLVLQSVAARLSTLMAGEQAMVSRFGADEFAIVIEDSPTTACLIALAKDINLKLSEPIRLDNQELIISAGMGMVRCPARGGSAVELVRTADTALHRAKRTGRGQWGLADPPADDAERTRYLLASAISAAWEKGEVTLCYQPLVRIDPMARDTGRIVAVQALLHWKHPERGVLPAEECLSLAEQTGLILVLGPWMLRQACAQLRSWRDQLGAAAPPVRIDLTTQLAQDPDLMAVLRGALDSAQLQPPDLQLGIPVELVISGAAEDNLTTLTETGVWTVLTRYGQAVGNLAALEDLPVHAVELTDRLVHSAAQQPASLVRDALTTLVPLIRDTDTAVVVAGIDSTQQAGWWRSIGADSARGAAFSPPVAPADIPALLTAP